MGQIFKHAEPYLDQLTVGRWVEIGCGRAGDDGSTRQLAEWSKQYSPTGQLTTVDVDPVNCDFVRALGLDNVEIINSTGEEYLESFPAHTDYIGFLYLDNFDWDWHPDRPEDFVRDQQERYTELGMEMTNVNSQRAHLRQAELALKALAPISLVVCDDTWYNPWWGHYSGKSGSVVPFLLNHGFEVLYTEEQPVYGTILGRRIIYKKNEC
jgi:hypothetical protein